MSPPSSSLFQQLPRHVYSFTAGLAAGGTIGAVGWGGAQVLIPALTWPHPTVAGLSQLSATGVSLTSLGFSTVTTGYQFWQDDQVQTQVAVMVGIPAVLSARAGTQWAKRLSGRRLALMFNIGSIVLIPTHFWIQERAKERRHLHQHHKEAGDSSNSSPQQPQSYDYRDPQVLFTFASFGLLAGLSSALMGVGGLPLSMSYLTEMTDLDHHLVQGTAVCSVIPSILTSATSRLTAIPLVTAGVVCAGAAVGGVLGAKLALALDDDDLRTLYMASLVLFGGRSVYGAVQQLRHLLRVQKKR